jgi:Tetracyclin repressor-like, C-terminal domain
VLDKWQSLFRQCILDAQASGEIDPKAEVAQAAFEIQAMLLAGNFQFVMTNDPIRLTQARRGVEHVLARLAVNEETKKRRTARGSP